MDVLSSLERLAPEAGFISETQVPSSRELLNYFSPAPDPQYQMYWFYANVQQVGICFAVWHTLIFGSDLVSNAYLIAWSAQSQIKNAHSTIDMHVRELQLLERSLLGVATNAGPADIRTSFKPFPWPAVQIDLGAHLCTLRDRNYHSFAAGRWHRRSLLAIVQLSRPTCALC